MACWSGATEKWQIANVKRVPFTSDHHKINLNLIMKAQQESFLGLTGQLGTQMYGKWIALKIAPEMIEADSD